jgi:hypothetical protein
MKVCVLCSFLSHFLHQFHSWRQKGCSELSRWAQEAKIDHLHIYSLCILNPPAGMIVSSHFSENTVCYCILYPHESKGSLRYKHIMKCIKVFYRLLFAGHPWYSWYELNHEVILQDFRWLDQHFKLSSHGLNTCLFQSIIWYLAQETLISEPEGT